MTVKDEGELSDEERRGVELAREIGALQKQARDIQRVEQAKRPGTARSYRKVPREVLFLGGATESSEAENADEAFRAADILRARRVAEDEQTGDVLRYKSGAKKGQPRYKQEGTLKDRNKRTLAKHVGKKVRIRVDFDQLSEGGKVTKSRRVTRTITYRDYDGLVRAYQDTMRGTIKRKSADAYYVTAVSFVPVKPKRKKKPTKKRKSTKRAATKRPTKKRPARRRAAVRRSGTGTSKRRGRRVGTARKRKGKKPSRARKRT